MKAQPVETQTAITLAPPPVDAFTDLESSSVPFGTTFIDYEIRRSARRKSVGIALMPTGEVVVTAPPEVGLQKLDALVVQKGAWILAHQRSFETLEPAPPPRQFISGETYLYLGRQYRLLVKVTEIRWPRLQADGGRLVVEMPASFPQAFRSRFVRRMLIGWYRRRAAERLEVLVKKWSILLDLPMPPILIRQQEKRWGSCDVQGRLRFNWRIVQAPVRLVEYVVAHELVHRLQPDHTDRFWAALGRVMPDYEARRELLRRMGARLEW